MGNFLKNTVTIPHQMRITQSKNGHWIELCVDIYPRAVYV